ncbi:MAG: PAQR family membrane homeostasis protein TrhA [Breznakia sp.]
MNKHKMKDFFPLTFAEEVFNSVSHGVMASIMLLLIPASAVFAYIQGGFLRSFGISVFTLSIFLMLLSSTLYHAMAIRSNQKIIFRILDHIFIYVAIAGSYTPIAICLIGGMTGIIICVIQWSMVLIGILYKCLSTKSLPKLSLTIYLIMGWTVVLFIPSLLKNATIPFLFFLALGGILYSVGAYFYTKRFKFAHAIWHLFINAALICHYIAIVFLM